MSNRDYRILISDPDSKSLTYVRDILKQESFQAWVANDPGEILRVTEAGNFDLHILDVRIFAQLRRQNYQLKSPSETSASTIILTTDADFALTIEAIKEGAVDFIERPIRVKRLLLTINNALQQSRKIREIQREQNALAALKELYERIINGIDYGIVVLDQDLHIQSINQFWRRRQRDGDLEIIGKPCYKYFYNRRAVCDECRIKEVFNKRGPVKYNLVHKVLGGATLHLEIEAFPLCDAEGRINRVVQLIKDVTERVKLEQELREKKEYLENLLAHAPVGIFTTDQDGYIRMVNPAFTDILGAPNALEALGLNVFEGEEFKRHGLDLKFKQTLVQGQSFAMEGINYTSPWGKQLVCSLRSVPLRGENDTVAGLIATVADVSEKVKLEESYRKRIEELSIFKEVGELLQSTVDLKDIYSITLIGVTAGIGLGFNRAFLLRYDRTKNTLVGEAAIGPSDAEEAGRIWSELYEKKLTLRETFENHRNTYASKDVRVNEMVRNLQIALTWNEGLLQDVLFRNKPKKIKLTNERHSEEENLISAALGCQEFAVVPLISRGKVEGIIIADNLISSKEISDEDVNRLSIIANQAGSAIENSQLLQSLEEKVEALRLAYLDLKENRDLLLRAERLSIVGEVAASVAHEIRNPLTSIGGFARTVLRDLERPEKLNNNRRFLGIITEEVKRLEGIVTEILGFVKPVAPRLAPTDINELLDQTLMIISGEIDVHRVVITRDLHEDLPRIQVDPDQMRQVLLNLFRNALYAMKDGGMLSVFTVLEADCVQIHIADTGEGIPRQHIEKLFNAFFTTKSTGSGLGLTISQQIIKNHGGSIGVESEVGEGSTFIISLPLRRMEVARHEEENFSRRRRRESAPSV